MAKILFIVIIVLYAGVIGIWYNRFTISNELTNGTNHALVVDHDFTEAEREGVERAYRIRRIISSILLYSSLMISAASFIILYNQWIEPKAFVKVVMYVSGFIAIVLLLVDGIHFIPGLPIR